MTATAPSPRFVAWLIVGAVIVLGASFYVRFAYVEPQWIGQLCASGDGPWWCLPRGALIEAFRLGALGGLSAVAGLWAAWRGGRAVAALALLAGIAGLVFYNTDIAALGTLLGLWRIVRV